MRRVWKWFKDKTVGLEMWWGLYGQFSAPVQLISPRPRRIHREARSDYATPACAEAQLERFRQHVADRRYQEELMAAIQNTDEAVLYQRIFGQPPPDRDREQ